MGNEMGNSNTSGLQEEENSIAQVEEKSVQETGSANGAALENHTASVSEGKDYHQKENGLASDVPNREADLHLASQTSDETKEEETEVQPPAESSKVEVKSNDEASDESSEIQQNSITNSSKDLEKPLATADVKAENHFVLLVEDKDYQEKEIIGLTSDVPKGAEDPYAVEQIPDEREQEVTGVHAPAESPKPEVESNGDGSDTSDIPLTSPSKHSIDHEIPKNSELEENLRQISDHQLEKQTSGKKEEEAEKNSASETISSSDNPEPLKFEDSKLDQSELYPILADQPMQDSNGHTHEEILGANLNLTTEENGHNVDTKISKDTDEIVVSGSNLETEMSKDDLTVEEVTLEEEVLCEDRSAIKDGDDIGGNDFSEKAMIKSDLPKGEEIKCNAEIPTEIDPISTDSPKAEPEVTSMEKSLNTHIEDSESTDKCVVLAAETIWIERESEYGENKPKDCPTLSCEESVKESSPDNANLFQSEFLMIESVEENNKKRISDFTCCGSEGNMDCVEDAKVAENCHLADENINDQIEASVECSKDSQKEAEEMVVESEILLTELSITDFKREEVSEERQIIEEIEEKMEASYGIGNNSEAGEQCTSTTLPVEQEEVSLPMVQISFARPHENRQNNEMHSEKIQSGNDTISELNQETYSDLTVTEPSCFNSKIAETLACVAELAIEKHEQDLPNHIAKSMMTVAECSTQENPLNEECEKVEMLYLASDDYQAQESTGRFSTESNPNNSNTQAQMQKSPSFGLDLRIEARTEESDRTPLLYQDKIAIEDFSTEADVSLGNPIAHTQSDQNILQYQEMPEPVEEKVVRMERSDSEKSKPPFLGFLKEEEEAHIIVTPQKPENNTTAKKANKENLNLQTKEVASTSRKSKEKRKAKSCLFTNCMCCTTVIN